MISSGLIYKSSSQLFLFLLLFPLATMTVANPPEIIRFSHLTSENGLTQNYISAILHDSDGFMWFGSQGGLNKFDGYEFTTYQKDPGNPNSLRGNYIRHIYEDSQNNLWIAVRAGGLSRYDREKDEFHHFYESPEGEETLTSNSVSVIHEDRSNNLWVGTTWGLNRIDRDTWEYNNYLDDNESLESLSGNMIYSIYEDSRGNLWIGTDNGLNLMDREDETFEHYHYDSDDPQSLGANQVNAIYEDLQGNLWVGTSGGGINLFDYETEQFQRFIFDEKDPQSISGNTVLDILEDSKGVLWVVTENQGLNVLNREDHTFYNYRSQRNNPNSLNSDAVISIYEGRDQTLWVGTTGSGLNYTDRLGSEFVHYQQEPDLKNTIGSNIIRSFIEDSNDDFWVGTDGGGLNRFNRRTGEFFEYRHDPLDGNSIPSDVILDIEQADEGNIWLGTYGGGLSLFDPQEHDFTHFQKDAADPGSLNDDDIFALYKDSQNYLWIGTNKGGLNRFDPESGEFIHYTNNPDNINDPGGPDNNSIRAIFEDQFEDMWFGSYGERLIRYDRSKDLFHFYDVNSGHLYSSVILSIFEDSDDRLWLATRGGGLKLFDRDSDTVPASYNVSDGLPGNVVNDILEDKNGYLWLSTNNGISRFDPSSEDFTNFSLADGLQGREFNSGASYLDGEGYMYFGGVNGFNRFHPDSVEIEKRVPPIVLTDFQILNESVEISSQSPLRKHISQVDEVKLSHDVSVITFNYATLNYQRNKNDQFAYLMEGFDEEWNYVGSQRTATYTNLDPGNYVFKVRASNKDGVWGGAEASVGVVITPPFWQTAWFQLLAAFLSLGIVISAIHFRMSSIKKQNRKLEKKVSKRTEQLNKKNSDLEKALADLKETRSKLIEEAHKAGMADLATGVLHNVGNLLNSVNVSATMINDGINNLKLLDFKEANKLLREHMDDLENFIIKDPKAKKLLEFYLMLEEPMDREYEELRVQKQRLAEKIRIITDVVAAQQTFSQAGRVSENISLQQVVEDTLVLKSSGFKKNQIHIRTNFQTDETVDVEKSKLIHILINLFNNAKEAMQKVSNERILTIETYHNREGVFLSVADTGEGIDETMMTKIFTHGFTTKETGHGYGLHSCANYMKEMGGALQVHSDGPGRGANFVLMFPKRKKTNKSAVAAETTVN